MNDLKVETLCRITCSIYFYISHPIIVVLAFKNINKNTEKQKVVRIIHLVWEKLDFIAPEVYPGKILDLLFLSYLFSCN